MRILRGAVSALEAALRVGELEQKRLDELAAIIDTQLKSLSPKGAMRLERACFIKLFDSLASDRVKLADVYDEPALSLLGSVSLGDIREAQIAVTKMWTELIEVADDSVESIAVAQRLDKDASPLSMSLRKHALPGSLMPSATIFTKNTARSVAELRCTLAALAAERYRQRNDRLPRSFADLIPAFLDSAPTDPFNGDPLTFITTEVGVAVYSVGPNMADDGGDFTVPEGKYHPLDIGFRLAEVEKRGTIVTEVVSPRQPP